MQVKKLNEAIDIVKDGLRGSLISTDIWQTADGQSIAAYNTQPMASALFNRITNDMNGALKDSGFPTLGMYYFLDLTDGNKVLVIPMDKYQWGVLVDKNCQMGFLLNVLLPKMVDKFEESLVE